MAPADVLEGVVEVRLTGAGSKSEMTSVVLLPDPQGSIESAGFDTAAPVVLRRKDAVALDAEESLAAYAGQRVRVTGRQAWATFVVDSVEALDG
jgi:hypothetical protein